MIPNQCDKLKKKNLFLFISVESIQMTGRKKESNYYSRVKY